MQSLQDSRGGHLRPSQHRNTGCCHLPVRAHHSPSAVVSSRSLKIRQTLEGALNESRAPTLVELGRRLGYSSSTVLRVHEPDLCDLLADRRQRNVKKYRSDLKRAAKAALNETLVPSVRDLCKRLGVTVWFMGKYFPSVRRMIAEKRRQVASDNTKRRREKVVSGHIQHRRRTSGARSIPFRKPHPRTPSRGLLYRMEDA